VRIFEIVQLLSLHASQNEILQISTWQVGAFSLLSNSATVLEAELEGTNWACSRKAPIFVVFCRWA
jgi:hypothetical protein